MTKSLFSYVQQAGLVTLGVLMLSACSGSGNPTPSSTLSNDDITLPEADPLVPGTLTVQFDITVPAYQSNELLVVLQWGDTRVNAEWVGDEYWSASAEIITETEQLVSITFYDGNGSVELASASQSIRVGSDASAPVQITADQFDDTPFDQDQDGISNLDELISGTDPSIDEFADLEIIDEYNLSQWNRMSVSHNLEARLSDERPFYRTFDLDPDFPHYQSYEYLSLNGEVDLDSNGNGTFYYSFYFPLDQLTLSGTRTNSGNAITWEGTRSAYDGDYGHRVEFTNTIAILDENTRSYSEQIIGSNVGTYDYRWEKNINLIAERIEGTPLCKPIAGSVHTTYRTNPGNLISESIVRKDIGDRYWQAIGVEDDTETVGLLFRNISMYRVWGFADTAGGSLTLEDDHFICDFPEFN